MVVAAAILSGLLSLPVSDASAFWGKETQGTESGLDLSGGFDVNTLTTVSGAVIQPPESSGKEGHAVIVVRAPQGAVTVIMGPWWYWEKHGVTIVKDHEISVTGSLAQGKDGAFYLFAQRITDRTTGDSVQLRTESGKPMWSRGMPGGRGSRQGTRGASRGGSMRGGR